MDDRLELPYPQLCFNLVVQGHYKTIYAIPLSDNKAIISIKDAETLSKASIIYACLWGKEQYGINLIGEPQAVEGQGELVSVSYEADPSRVPEEVKPSESVENPISWVDSHRGLRVNSGRNTSAFFLEAGETMIDFSRWMRGFLKDYGAMSAVLLVGFGIWFGVAKDVEVLKEQVKVLPNLRDSVQKIGTDLEVLREQTKSLPELKDSVQKIETDVTLFKSEIARIGKSLDDLVTKVNSLSSNFNIKVDNLNEKTTSTQATLEGMEKSLGIIQQLLMKTP